MALSHAQSIALVLGISQLTAADLERHGAIDMIRAQAPSVEIEDIEYEPFTLLIREDGFDCLATAYFTCDFGAGATISDEMLIHVSGRFEGDQPMFDTLELRPNANHQAAIAPASQAA